jgi:hypothetical protein
VAARDVLGGPIAEPQQRNPFLAPMHGPRSSRRAALSPAPMPSPSPSRRPRTAGAGERPPDAVDQPGARRSRHQPAADPLGRLAAGPPHRQSGPPPGSPRHPVGQGAKGLTSADQRRGGRRDGRASRRRAGRRPRAQHLHQSALRPRRERAPRGRSLGHASLGAWPAGSWVSPGSSRCPPIDLRRNVTSMASITCQAGERPRPW